MSVPTSGFTEGQLVAGKYQVTRELGAGGMCIVYEAEHTALAQGIALKVLKPELVTDRECVDRFEREARAAAQLRSPNVARVYDVDWAESGQPYITMELLVGHDVGAELARLGRVPVDIAVDYVRQACRGIAEAHALGIVHRDLKPENLFLTDLGSFTDRKLLKILDFGIAKNIAESARRLTAPDAVFGTVDYMSPEQIRSATKVDHRTDLWSLGVILYELLTGRTPFTGDARAVIAQIVSDPIPPPDTIVPDLPPSLVATVMRALEKDAGARFQSAEEMRAALEGYGENEDVTSLLARLPPESVPRRAPITGEHRPVSRPPPSGIRDQRTQGAWETKREITPARALLRASVVLPAVLVVAVAIGGLYVWRGSSAATKTTSDAHAASALAAAPPAPPSPAPDGDGGVATTTDSPSDSKSSSPGRRRHPPPVGHPPSPPPKTTAAKTGAPPTTSPNATPPSTPDPTSRLPKHL